MNIEHPNETNCTKFSATSTLYLDRNWNSRHIKEMVKPVDMFLSYKLTDIQSEIQYLY
jgi:hypothetical protein